MISMRRYIIVKEHGILPFPEGTACSEILKAKETKKASAISAFWSFLIASLYKISSNVFFIFGEFFHIKIPFLKNTKFSVDGTPALLGVGYIVGFRITSMLFAGGSCSKRSYFTLLFLFNSVFSFSSIFLILRSKKR